MPLVFTSERRIELHDVILVLSKLVLTKNCVLSCLTIDFSKHWFFQPRTELFDVSILVISGRTELLDELFADCGQQ